MELPPFHHHHHHRYVPPQSNFYRPHSHRLPPPPPLPPLPPPHHLSHPRPPLPPPPPPPPIHQSQFSFLPHHHPPIDERPSPAAAGSQFSNFIPPHLLNESHPLSPHRIPSNHHQHRNLAFYDENSCLSDRWRDLPPLPRVPTEPSFRHRQPLSPILPRTDSYLNDFQRNVRFRDDLMNERFRDNDNPELPSWGGRKDRDFDFRDDGDKYRYHSGRDGFGRRVSSVFDRNINSGFERNTDSGFERNADSGFERNIDSGFERNTDSGFEKNTDSGFERNIDPGLESNINSGFGRIVDSGFKRNIDRINRDILSAIRVSPSSDFALNVGSYELYNDREEDLRRGYSLDDYNDGDGVRLPSHGMPHELLDSGYSDVDRFDNNRLGEVEQEFFSQSPRKKQVQKKSALLRIQLGKANNRNNNMNRSHDNTRYSRSYYDDSNLNVSSSFKGKEKDVYVHPELKMEGQREKSPVELDISFRSNALVAKAIKTTSSAVVESDKKWMPRNRKLKKINVADSPGMKLSEDSVKSASSTHEFDPSYVSYNNHKELTDRVISFKADSSAGCLDCPSSSGKHSKESSEKDNAMKTDSCATELKFSFGSNKDPGLLAEKMSGCDSTTNAVDENIAGKESAKLIGSNQGVKRVAPDEVLKQRASKRKTVGIGLQNEAAIESMSFFCEPSNPENSSTNSLCAASQLDEGVSQSIDRIPSVRMNTMNDEIFPSLVNDRSAEEVNIASDHVILDLKEDGVSISSSFPLPSQSQSQSSALISEPLQVENGPSGKVMESVEESVGLSSLKESKVYDSQLDISTSRDAYSVSISDEGYCERPGNVTVANIAYVNAGSKEFILNKVNMSHENDIDKDSSDPNLSVTLVGILGSPKIEKRSVDKGAENQDLYTSFSSSPICSTSGFSDSLVKRTVPDICLLDDSSNKSIVEGATTLTGNATVEISSKTVVSHSSSIGRKRKARDDQLDVLDEKTSKMAGSIASSLDDEDTSSSLWAKNIVSVEEEVLGNGDNTLEKDCLEEGLLDFISPVQGGKKRKEFTLTSPSPVLSKISPGPKVAIVSNPSAEPPSYIEEGTTHPDDIVIFCDPADNDVAGFTAYSETSVVQFQEVSIAGESYQSLGGGSMVQCSKLEPVTSCLPTREADIQDNTPFLNSTSDLQLAKGMLSGGNELNFITPDTSQKQLYRVGDCENYLLLKENLAGSSNNVSLCADVFGASASSSTDGHIDSAPDTLSNMGSPEDFIPNLSSDMLKSKSRLEYQGKDNLSDKIPISGVDMMSFSLTQSSHISETGITSGYALAKDTAVNAKAVSLLSQSTFKATNDSNPLPKKSGMINNRLNSSFNKDSPGHTSIKYPSAAKVSPFNHIAKPRTWHRTLNSSPSVAGPKSHGNSILPQINLKKEVGKVQSSYVRRGNSLVRKPSPVGANPQVLQASSSSVHHLNSGIDNARKDRGSENRIDVIDPPCSATFGGSYGCPERPKTPPLIGNVKLLNCITPNPGDLTLFLLADPPSNDCPGETKDPCKSAEDMDTNRSSEDDLKSSKVNGCQTGSSNYLDCRRNVDETNSGKKLLYVKRKSNQLVAASSSDDLSLCSTEKTQVLSSDGYYKRRKNQLIRTSLKGVKQRVVVPDKSLSSKQQEAQKNIQSRSSSKMQSGKGFVKKKFSLVWTLNDTVSSRKDGASGRWHRVLPYLFPWKRASYSTNFMHSLSAIPNDSPIPTIGQKLLLSRKRDAIYKRSVSGFSLRRSKVLGVGGRSLKWSKSIEKNSRKANEDATLAVVAAEKRKKAQNGAVFTLSRSRNYVSRERIFRIGSERYRMDPTRKTLQRISDEQPSYSDDHPEKSRKKFYVPRRLLIGTDEYVRVGNGNQLVRDPKRRTRALANEKVRWSLHTARLRLARKKKYCQFFTRFGKCNKDGKKCPYIHDTSKVAVCTKFLNGSCSNPNCKLTHEVIPERMQDCSYFLQGLCSNESCPYRHVNVNPGFPICESFLRGYCADGNECRKKHTYVCPVFEATGGCPQGPKCKLHHPKKKKKGMKRKASNLQKNARGRYFGARSVDISDSRTTVSGIISGKVDNDCFNHDGKFVDYISLDFSIGEMEQAPDLRSEPTCDSEEPSDVQVTELDEMIKPIRLMNKNMIIDSSPAVDSPIEVTTSYVSEESHCCR